MSFKLSEQRIGASLIVGGAGFLGYHVVNALAQQSQQGQITVASRNPVSNHVEGVNYIQGDITDPSSIERMLNETDPEVIFHLASPRATDAYVRPRLYDEVVVMGTDYLLAAARRHPSVKALVFASSACVSQGYEHFHTDERAPLWTKHSKTFSYYKAKSIAEAAVLAANSRPDARGLGVLTATLRFPMIYGERDNQAIPGQLEACMKGQTKIQLGDGTNECDPVYGPIAAHAHVLAAKGLLASQQAPLDRRVDGEAFHITNGDPQLFWDFSRRIWRLVGDQTKPEDVTVISKGVALGLASAIETGFSIMTLGFVKPPINMSKVYMQYSVCNATYSIQKARERLGFNPQVDLEASLRCSIASTLATESKRFRSLQLTEQR